MDNEWLVGDWMRRSEVGARLVDRMEAAQGRWAIDGELVELTDDVWPEAEALARSATSGAAATPHAAHVGADPTGTGLWDGQRERWAALLSPRPETNVCQWAVVSHRHRSREMRRSLAREAHGHLVVVQLRTGRAVRWWLASVRVGLRCENIQLEN